MVRSSHQVPVEEELPTPALQEAETAQAGRVLVRDKRRHHVVEKLPPPKIKDRMTCPKPTFAWQTITKKRSERDPEMTTNIE